MDLSHSINPDPRPDDLSAARKPSSIVPEARQDHHDSHREISIAMKRHEEKERRAKKGGRSAKRGPGRSALPVATAPLTRRPVLKTGPDREREKSEQTGSLC
jgi:hypothetical protein